ncbi:hypothetical protein Glove_688g34 [Diversispora epigaea]|uniref:Chromo domain-containing protein n=1 Tax=Diversispora epigaea TaxID=1348612 RepID=A0A397G2A7_9GLOM|nr:hypothetical protein Glove_688g34 [Diversispora epigaea]
MSTKNKSEEEVVNELGDEFLNYDGVEAGNGGTEENTTTENVEKKAFESVAEVKQPTEKSKDSEEVPLGKSGKVNTDTQEQAESGQTNGKAEQKDENENEEDKENNKEVEEEVFEVEAILDHKKHKNLTKYYIKWKGFALEDSTWENEDDVYAEELLEEYWAKQSQPADSSKSSQIKRKAGRKRAAQSPPPTPVKRETKKHRSQTKTKTTTTKTRTEQQEEDETSQQASTTTASSTESWEDKVIAVETVTRDDKTGDLLVYLKWNNGETSRHPAKDVNIKCPQKMIKFYEQRLTFAPPSTHNKS